MVADDYVIGEMLDEMEIITASLVGVAPPQPHAGEVVVPGAHDAVIVLRYRMVEKSPYRVTIRTTAEVRKDDNYDLSLVATAGKDKYLMSLGGGAANDTFFTWNDDGEWGVDCAAGCDSLLVLATVICAGPQPLYNIHRG